MNWFQQLLWGILFFQILFCTWYNWSNSLYVADSRIFGKIVAEVPLVATRFQYRRLGMCRVLMNELEEVFCSCYDLNLFWFLCFFLSFFLSQSIERPNITNGLNPSGWYLLCCINKLKTFLTSFGHMNITSQ